MSVSPAGGDHRRQEGLPRRDGRHEGARLLLQVRRDHLENHRRYPASRESRSYDLIGRSGVREGVAAGGTRSSP